MKNTMDQEYDITVRNYIKLGAPTHICHWYTDHQVLYNNGFTNPHWVHQPFNYIGTPTFEQ